MNNLKGSEHMKLIEFAETIFNQTDFLICLILSQEKQADIYKLKEQSNYPRSTINTTLTRLLERGVISKDKGERNYYVYEMNDQIEVSKEQLDVFYHLFFKFKSLMTPNVIRVIICLLTNDDKKFNIQTAVATRNWSESTLIKSIKRLTNSNIIEKKQADYIFSESL